MSFIDFSNIKCRLCNKFMVNCKLHYNAFIINHYTCECYHLSYDVFSEKENDYSFCMSFPGKYQIQIHNKINNLVFSFKKNNKHTYHNLLSLDYIPDLNWHSPDLLNQLLLLTTFK